jgi:hypothetical protein
MISYDSIKQTGAKLLWMPQYKQSLAMACPAFELLFGGAAGGGKSDWILADFLAGVWLHKNNWKGILFRQTFGELKDLQARADALYLPLGARTRDKGRQYVFPTGAMLEFAYLEHDKDVRRYQGRQFTWVGFDELGNYASDFAWRYMISRARSPAGVPCYMRATANPGGAGHAWIKTRFIDGFEPYKTYRVTEMTGSAKTEVTRCFIPSTIEDNKALMRGDPGYAERMKLLPGQQYRALRYGDWDVFAGQVFDEFRREKHVVKPFALEPGSWKKFYALDWGYKAPFSLGKWAVNHEGRMVRYGEWYGCSKDEMNTGIRMGVADAAAKAWDMALQEGVTECVADTSMWGKEDDGPTEAEKWEQAGFKMIQANKDRLNGLAMFHQRLQTTGEDGRPMLLVFDHCVNFIRTIPMLTPDPSNPEDIDSHGEDHIYDESRYAIMSDFAHNPANALRRQNGNWNFATVGKGWNPHDY